MRCLSFRGFQGVRFQETRVGKNIFITLLLLFCGKEVELKTDLSMASLDVMVDSE